jgi:aryl carrier-like protein
VRVVEGEELERIWGWNWIPPTMRREEGTGRLRADLGVVRKGEVYQPRVVVPWVCSVRSPEVLAPVGTPGELWLEGDCLSGEGVVDSPAWLLAGAGKYPGRKGKVQPTGDIVKLQDDGTLVFVGRKDEMVAAQGKTTAVAELEAHLGTSLPAPFRSAAATRPDGSLAVLVQKPEGEEDATVKILDNSMTISLDKSGPLEITICDSLPASLAVALKRFDKFAQNSLASHLVPSGYVVVDNLPDNNRNSLEELASKLSPELLNALRDGFQKAWTTAPAATTALSAPEAILRSAWSAVLGIPADKIDTDDNFFRLGGDSVLAMKLVSRLRSSGHVLTVADIFRHMRLGDAAKVLKVNAVAPAEASNGIKKTEEAGYKPFSLTGVENAAIFVADVIRPRLQDPSWTVKDVCPVTDSQAIDVVGTVRNPRTSVQYTTLRSATGFDLARLTKACQVLVDAHDILRTVFVEHDSALLQVVLESLQIPVATHTTNAEEDLEKSVERICTAHLEDPSSFKLGGPFVHFMLVRNGAGDTQEECFVFALSHALYDGVSLPLLLRDLSTLYAGQTPSPAAAPVPFTSYLALTRDRANAEPALSYWRGLLAGSRPSVLPGQSATKPRNKALFLTAPALPTTSSLQKTGTTTATLLTAAWALVLARRLGTRDVTFGSITSGRTAPAVLLAAGDATIDGPCYQFTPVRVKFDSASTTTDLLANVQRQAAESSSWDYLGIGAVAPALGWSVKDGQVEELDGPLKGRYGVFFDSVVHHQDWEDFDEMELGETKCRVDIVNPHGDSARPLKVVSFVKGGEVHVGIVGYEEERELLQEVLAQLVETAKELVEGGSRRLLEETVEVREEVAKTEEVKAVVGHVGIMKEKGDVIDMANGAEGKRKRLWKRKWIERLKLRRVRS